MNYAYANPELYSPQKGILKVNGIGVYKAEPNIAVITLGVISEDMSLEKAQRENSEKTASVIDSLHQTGIQNKDIRTAVYDIQPIYDYVEGKQIFRGYRVTNLLSVTIRNIKNVGTIIDSAVSSGANRVENIRFTVDNMDSYYKLALDEAVKNALDKAISIGSDLQVHLDPVPIKVTEESNTAVPFESATMKLAAGPTPIMPGQIDITARIEGIFEYRY